MPRAQGNRKRESTKARVTLSLEKSTLAYLQRHQAEVKAASLSASVESLVAARQRQAQVDELGKQISAYYDSISDDERAENQSWGQLGERELRASKR